VVKIREVADNIYRFEKRLPIMGTVLAVYFIKEPKGALIDTGPTAFVPQISEAMNQLGIKELAFIMPTHIHVDHAGGIGKLAQLFPEAKVVIHPAGLKHVIDPSRLIESTKTVFGSDFESGFGPILPVPESQLKVPEDSEIIKVGGKELQIIYAPGHAPHHIVIFDRRLRGLFCGEALGLQGEGNEHLAVPAVAPPSFDQETYLQTMDKLRKLQPRILFFAHGGVSREPEKLISSVENNTRLLGDLILRALKGGDSIAEIKHKVREAAKSSFGIELTKSDLDLTVGGYTVFYQRKGLV
jgi:glyoxylase-like metal-dependent hydrolase (beta-lactamase superfamily II)